MFINNFISCASLASFPSFLNDPGPGRIRPWGFQSHVGKNPIATLPGVPTSWSIQDAPQGFLLPLVSSFSQAPCWKFQTQTSPQTSHTISTSLTLGMGCVLRIQRENRGHTSQSLLPLLIHRKCISSHLFGLEGKGSFFFQRPSPLLCAKSPLHQFPPLLDKLSLPPITLLLHKHIHIFLV